MKKALITGITGPRYAPSSLRGRQDGSYLAELLLEKGYEVHGIIRRASTFNTKRIDHLYKDPHNKNIKMFLHYGDLIDSSNLNRILEKVQPDEIYPFTSRRDPSGIEIHAGRDVFPKESSIDITSQHSSRKITKQLNTI